MRLSARRRRDRIGQMKYVNKSQSMRETDKATIIFGDFNFFLANNW